MPVDTSEIGTYRRLFDNKFGEIQELLADLPGAALTWKPVERAVRRAGLADCPQHLVYNLPVASGRVADGADQL